MTALLWTWRVVSVICVAIVAFVAWLTREEVRRLRREDDGWHDHWAPDPPDLVKGGMP